MHRQVLQLHEDRQAKQQAANAEQQATSQQVVSAHAKKVDAGQIRQLQAGLAARGMLRLPKGQRGCQQARQRCHGPVLPFEKGRCAVPGRKRDLQALRTDMMTREPESHEE